MKLSAKKIIAIICAFIFLATPLQIFALGDEDGKFVELSVVGYDKEGKQKNESSVFYVKDNVLYAPAEFFEKYTLYRYDNENNAFVRSSQEYMKSTSKVIFDYEKNTARVLYSATYAEDYDIVTYMYGNTRFFPLAQTAGYLKSSIVYQDKDKISIVNSGISIWDALYDYIPEGESLSYAKICDDLYAGNDLIYKVSGALGYFGETVFDFRLSNLVVIGPYADIKKYEDILSSAVTNNDIYKAAFDKNTLQSELLDLTFKRIVGDLYGSSEKTYSLTSQAISTIYDDHKDSIFTDDNLYDTPFENMKLDVAELKEIGEIVDLVGTVIDIAEYIYEFTQMNSDNRDALAYVNMNCQTKDSEAKAIGKVNQKYIKAVNTDISLNILEKVTEELKSTDGAEKLLTDVNKIKLATGLVNAAFKLGGFDLSDNSSYDVLMASDLYYYLINKSPVIKQGYAKTLKESEEMRLANIMLMLVNIEAYKLGNNVAKRIDNSDSNHYGRQIAEMEQRLVMLYRAQNSEKYDCIEGIKTVIEENQEEIAKFDFAALKSTEYNDNNQALFSQYNSNVNWYFSGNDDYIVYFDVIYGGIYPQGNIVRIDKKDNSKKILQELILVQELFVYEDEIYYSDMGTRCIYKLDMNGENKEMVFEDREEGKNSSRTIPHDFIIADDKLIIQTVFVGGSYTRLYIVDLNSGKKRLLDENDDEDLLYANEKVLCYHTDVFLKIVDIQTGKLLHKMGFDENLIPINIDHNYLYYYSKGFDSKTGNIYNIYRLNLYNNESTLFKTIERSESITAFFINNENVYVVTGMGNMQGFGVLQGDEIIGKYDLKNDPKYTGLEPDYLGEQVTPEFVLGDTLYVFGDTLYRCDEDKDIFIPVYKLN